MATAPASPSGDIARRDIESTLGTDISTYRARLIDKAIIEDTQRGYLRFTLPGFADYIRRNITAGSGTPISPERLRRTPQPPASASPASPPPPPPG